MGELAYPGLSLSEWQQGRLILLEAYISSVRFSLYAVGDSYLFLNPSAMVTAKSFPLGLQGHSL